MNEFTRSFIHNTSVGLPDGGDTHVHPWENGRGLDVTTRLPGDVTFHDSFRFKDLNGQRTPACPDVLRFLP